MIDTNLEELRNGFKLRLFRGYVGSGFIPSGNGNGTRRSLL